MKMQNLSDPDGPTAWFWTDHNGRSGLAVCTKKRLMYLPAKFWAKVHVTWCRLFHRKKVKTFGLPAAGKKLHYPITCMRCGCRYDITRPNNGKWISPWSKDK